MSCAGCKARGCTVGQSDAGHLATGAGRAAQWADGQHMPHPAGAGGRADCHSSRGAACGLAAGERRARRWHDKAHGVGEGAYDGGRQDARGGCRSAADDAGHARLIGASRHQGPTRRRDGQGGGCGVDWRATTEWREEPKVRGAGAAGWGSCARPARGQAGGRRRQQHGRGGGWHGQRQAGGGWHHFTARERGVGGHGVLLTRGQPGKWAAHDVGTLQRLAVGGGAVLADAHAVEAWLASGQRSQQHGGAGGRGGLGCQDGKRPKGGDQQACMGG